VGAEEKWPMPRLMAAVGAFTSLLIARAKLKKFLLSLSLSLSTQSAIYEKLFDLLVRKQASHSVHYYAPVPSVVPGARSFRRRLFGTRARRAPRPRARG